MRNETALPSKTDDARLRERIVIELSRQSAYKHFVERDMDAAMAHMADDIVWLGPFSLQTASSLKDMKEILRAEYDTRLALADEQWIAKRRGSVWIANAIYTVLVKSHDGRRNLPFTQHATYVWAPTPDGPRIVHLHVSNTTDANEAFPQLAENENALNYLLDHFETLSASESKMEFRDVEGKMHFLHPDEICCVMAEGPRCRVRHSQGSFLMRTSMGELEQKFADRGFLRTHRSCLANMSRAREVARFQLVLDDGTACPVAEKRYRDIKLFIEASA